MSGWSTQRVRLISSAALVLALVAGAREAAAVVDLRVAGCQPVADACAGGGAGSGDGRVDPGESASSDMFVRNLGDEDATNVVGTVSALTPGVAVTQPSVPFGTVPPGGPGVPMMPFEFTVDASVPCGASLDFEVALTSDQQDTMGTCAISVPMDCTPCASGANLEVQGCQAVADACGVGAGDADGDLDPGETGMVRLVIANVGAGDATGVVATVSTSTPGVTVTQPMSNVGDVPSGDVVGTMEQVEIVLDLSVPCGSTIDLDVSLASDQGPFLDACTVPVDVDCEPCAADPVLALQQCAVATDSCPLGGAGDADGELEPGESGELRLLLGNSGGADATNVTAVVTSPTPGVTINQGMLTYGTVPAGGGMAVPMELVELDLDGTVACGTEVMLDVAFASDQGNFADACSIPVPVPCDSCVSRPVLGLESCNLATDACALGGAGDGDGELDPGEDGEARLVLINTGPSDATNVTGTVTSPTPGVTIVQGALSWGTVPAGGGAGSMELLELSLDETVPCDTAIELEVALASDQGAAMDACQLLVPNPCRPCTASGPGFVLDRSASRIAADACSEGGVGNANGAIDPGETVQLEIDVSNLGPGDATNVVGTLVAVTPGVMVTQASASYGDLTAGDGAMGDVAYGISVSEALLGCGDALELRLEFTSDEGVPPPVTIDEFSIPMACEPCVAANPPSVAYDGHVLLSDACSEGGAGDADGLADPGEALQLELALSNDGAVDLTNVQGTLVALQAGLAVPVASASFGDLLVGASASSLTAFEVEPSVADFACGDGLQLRLDVTTDQGMPTSPMVSDVLLADPCTPCVAPGGVPGEVPRLDVSCDGTGAVFLEWQAATDAETYRIHQGSLGGFYDHACTDRDLIPLSSTVTGLACGDGTDAYLLVVGVAADGTEGPYGNGRPAGDCP